MSAASGTLTQEQLVDAIVEFLSGDDLLPLDDITAALDAEIGAAGPAALEALHERLTRDLGWTYYPPDPLARRIHHVLAYRFLRPDSRVDGAAHLTVVGNDPVVLVVNHLSYADANVVEVLLRRAGAGALADRLTAIAGPKVFTSRRRRFSSLCFGAVKVPQSTDVSSEEARLHARDVARAARQALDAAHARLAAGDALLLFAEGTRSRTGAMNRMLPGAARYLEGNSVWLIPAGLTGSEMLFPIDADTVHPARAELRVGQPIRSEALLAAAGRDRRLTMDAVGLAVADLLPREYRGVYNEEMSEPRRVLASACEASQ